MDLVKCKDWEKQLWVLAEDFARYKQLVYPLDGNFGIPGPFGHGNQLPTCKYSVMQPHLCGGGLGALYTYFVMS